MSQLTFKSSQLPVKLTPWLNPWGEQFGMLERSLHAYKAAHPKATTAEIKKAFLHQYGILAREFNALNSSHSSKIASCTEILKDQKTDLAKGIKSCKSKIAQHEKTFKKLKGSARPAEEQLAFEKAKAGKYWQALKLQSMEHRLANVMAELSNPVPSLAFGGSQLFQAQYKEGTDHEEWLRAWRDKRSSQFFLLGSHDETAGNQLCQLTHLGGDKFRVSLRLPDWLRHRWPAHGPVKPTKGGSLPLLSDIPVRAEFDMRIPYGAEHIVRALEQGLAISFRFISSSDGIWQVAVSTDVIAPIKTASPIGGVIGIDLNVNHLAVAETDEHGNLVDAYSVPFNLYGKSGNHREQILSLAVDVAVEHASQKGKPLVVEDLDFTEKKKQIMALRSSARRVSLSGFCYSAFQRLIEGKCARRGIGLYKTNPAFTSVKGRLRYAIPLGLTVHESAAYVIARQGQGFDERLPLETDRFPVGGGVSIVSTLVKKCSRDTVLSWEKLHQSLNKRIIELYQHRGKAPPPTAVQEFPEETGLAVGA